MSAARIRIGIDVGGTFTDGAAVDERSGRVVTAKRFTTHGHLTEGVLETIADLIARAEVEAGEVGGVFHGTTLATNALVERRTPAVGLLCTQGFRDILTTRRTRRQYLYDIEWDQPADLVRRMLRREVEERLDHHGEVVQALDEDSVRREVEFLARNGVTDFAVAYLYAFLDPSHERRTEELIREVVPDAHVSLSSAVVPEEREFERTTTTVLNAMVGRLIERYVGELRDGVADHGVAAPLEIMKANGGVSSPESIAQRPIETYQSGPAAGVTAAVAVGESCDCPDLITFDVGGTTSDVSLIHDGLLDMSLEEELEWSVPVRVPMVRTRSVGSGGGSIAWVDKGGALRVGPQSSGSDPGPACYGHGGEAATLTDANLVLGRIGPLLLGGDLELDREAAEAAIQRDVAGEFGWSVVEAASAIVAVAAMDMVHLIREVSVNRGHDPRDFSLICFGGAGGLHAVEVARELGMNEVLLPPEPGVFSATGCLLADVRHELVRTFAAPAEPAPVDDLTSSFAAMAKEATAEVRRGRAESDGIVVGAHLHLRYHGEAYPIPVPFGSQEVPVAAVEDLCTAAQVGEAIEAFHGEHKLLYGFERDDPVEIVNVGVTATLPLAKPRRAPDRESSDLPPAPIDARRLYDDGEWTSAPVFDRDHLRFESRVEGPAVIEEEEATFVLPGGIGATVDEYGNIRVDLRGK